MGTYISASDIDDVFGTENVTRWSALDGSGTRDTDRISTAISWAEATVEARFRGTAYDLPLPSSPLVTRWCAVVAGLWLYESRGTGDAEREARFADLRDEVEREMALAAAGALPLDIDHLPRAPHRVAEAADA